MIPRLLDFLRRLFAPRTETIEAQMDTLRRDLERRLEEDSSASRAKGAPAGRGKSPGARSRLRASPDGGDDG